MSGRLILPAPVVLRTLGEADPQALVMTCDGGGNCRNSVRRSPRMVVPSRTPFAPGHQPMRVPTDLHYCELHAQAVDMSAYWTDARKAALEHTARLFRPADFRCDFEAATHEMMLTTTPEYRAFMERLGVRRVVA